MTLPLGIVALWLRTRLEDSPVFAEAKADSETVAEGESGGAVASLKTTMTYWQRILILMGFVLLLNIAYYTVLTFLPSYLSDTLGHSTTNQLHARGHHDHHDGDHQSGSVRCPTESVANRCCLRRVSGISCSAFRCSC